MGVCPRPVLILGNGSVHSGISSRSKEASPVQCLKMCDCHVSLAPRQRVSVRSRSLKEVISTFLPFFPSQNPPSWGCRSPTSTAPSKISPITKRSAKGLKGSIRSYASTGRAYSSACNTPRCGSRPALNTARSTKLALMITPTSRSFRWAFFSFGANFAPFLGR